MLETSALMKDGETARALTNMAATLVFGFLLFRLGEFAEEAL